MNDEEGEQADNAGDEAGTLSRLTNSTTHKLLPLFANYCRARGVSNTCGLANGQNDTAQ
jgi:hypothetical protein